MSIEGIPITDDHIHIDLRHGRGVLAARDFQRAGGSHIFLVSKPSWSHDIAPSSGSDFRQVFDETILAAQKCRESGLVVFSILGVHPAEIGRLSERMPLSEAVSVMKGGLDIAASFVDEGEAVAIKSGRPHYPVGEEVWAAANEVLMHALVLGAECGCSVQIHAETGPCADVVDMARKAGLDPEKVIKHYGVPETPLSPSMMAKDEAIPDMAASGRLFSMESDYMDDLTRPGSVLGPKSVPRFSRRLLEAERITEEDLWHIHTEAPSKFYGVEINLP